MNYLLTCIAIIETYDKLEISESLGTTQEMAKLNNERQISGTLSIVK